MTEFVRDVVSNTGSLVARNNNKFVLDCPAKLGQISTDATKLRQEIGRASCRERVSSPV